MAVTADVAGTAGATEFPAAPMDRPTRWTTAAFCAALLGLGLTIPTATDSALVEWLVGVVLPVGAIASAYGFAPRSYVVSPGTVRVRRRWFGGRTFRVTTAQPVAALFALGGIRLAGSGGAFGWYGLFWRKGTGRYRAYVTDRSRLVACQGPDGLLMISPLNPQEFVDLLPSAP